MTPAPAPDLRQELAAFGVTPQVLSFVLDVADRVPVQVGETTSTVYVRIVGADRAQTSLYVHKAFVSVALDPDRSGHYGALTGAAVERKNATHYLLAREKQLGASPSRAHAVDAAVESVEHFREKTGRSPGEKDSYVASCPACFQRPTPTGVCGCPED